MTRQEAIAVIREMLTAEQMEEVQYKIAVNEESREQEIQDYGSTEMETMDEVDGFFDCLLLAEEWAGQKEDKAAAKSARANLRDFRRVMVRIGYFIPISNEDYANTSVSHGRKSDHFPVIDGIRYDIVGAYGCFRESLV